MITTQINSEDISGGEKLFTRKQAAKYLTISKGKLAQLNIPKINIGRRVVYRLADITAWLERQAGGAA